jgi:hypothetical protein
MFFGTRRHKQQQQQPQAHTFNSPFEAIDAGKVTRAAMEWTRELRGFQSPEADAAFLGICFAATAVVKDAAGKNGLHAQWQCIRKGLTDKRHGEYPDLLRRIEGMVTRSVGGLQNWSDFAETVMQIAKPGKGGFPFNTEDTFPLLAAWVRAKRLPTGREDWMEVARGLGISLELPS